MIALITSLTPNAGSLLALPLEVTSLGGCAARMRQLEHELHAVQAALQAIAEEKQEHGEQ